MVKKINDVRGSVLCFMMGPGYRMATYMYMLVKMIWGMIYGMSCLPMELLMMVAQHLMLKDPEGVFASQ